MDSDEPKQVGDQWYDNTRLELDRLSPLVKIALIIGFICAVLIVIIV